MLAFHYTPAQAQTALNHMKQHMRYLAELPSPRLPAWAKTAASTTDAYLAQIASHHGAVLATFDHHIPGATTIPA